MFQMLAVYQKHKSAFGSSLSYLATNYSENAYSIPLKENVKILPTLYKKRFVVIEIIDKVMMN